MNVPLIATIAIRCVLTLLVHLTVAVTVDFHSTTMEQLVMVGLKHVDFLCLLHLWYLLQILMNVSQTMVVVIRCVLTLLAHLTVAVTVDFRSTTMEQLVMVGLKHVDFLCLLHLWYLLQILMNVSQTMVVVIRCVPMLSARSLAIVTKDLFSVLMEKIVMVRKSFIYPLLL